MNINLKKKLYNDFFGEEFNEIDNNFSNTKINETEKFEKNPKDYYEMINRLRKDIYDANVEIENLKIDSNKEFLSTKPREVNYIPKNENALSSVETIDDIKKIGNINLIEENKRLSDIINSLSEMLNSMVLKEEKLVKKINEIEDNYENKINLKFSEMNNYKLEIEKYKKLLVEKIEDNKKLKTKVIASIDYICELSDKVEYLEETNKLLLKQLEEQRQKNRKIADLDISTYFNEKN